MPGPNKNNYRVGTSTVDSGAASVVFTVDDKDASYADRRPSCVIQNLSATALVEIVEEGGTFGSGVVIGPFMQLSDGFQVGDVWAISNEDGVDVRWKVG